DIRSRNFYLFATVILWRFVAPRHRLAPHQLASSADGCRRSRTVRRCLRAFKAGNGPIEEARRRTHVFRSRNAIATGSRWYFPGIANRGLLWALWLWSQLHSAAVLDFTHISHWTCSILTAFWPFQISIGGRP